ncbi:DUF4097 family beta strand repeat-containing protein [Bacillus timonensis]|nr:DUF4097 family beta strand repeat-containing protein [Bacillus timonensis]
MRNWRIGTLTAGILFIAMGVLWLGNNFWQLPFDTIIMNAWPVLLIVLGIEVLLHHLVKRDSPLSFDGFSIFLVIIVGIVSALFYTITSTGILPAVKGVISQNTYTFDISERVENIDDIKEIIIEIPNGDIEVEGVNNKLFDASGSFEVSAANENEAKEIFEKSISIKTVGNKLVFNVKEPVKKTVFSWLTYSADVHFQVPKEIDVQVKAVNGDILTKNVLLSTDIKSVNGDIELVDIMGSLEVETTNGDINGKNISASLLARTINGDITFITENISGGSKLESTNGDVKLVVTNNSDIKIQAETSNGEVGGNVEWKRKNDSDDYDYEKEGSLQIGMGTYRVDLSTTNGEIIVDVK